tara:strand:+ start:981 stop:1235 length:255 start_codon:yes stop_codon:yes gene_type:complete
MSNKLSTEKRESVKRQLRDFWRVAKDKHEVITHFRSVGLGVDIESIWDEVQDEIKAHNAKEKAARRAARKTVNAMWKHVRAAHR